MNARKLTALAALPLVAALATPAVATASVERELGAQLNGLGNVRVVIDENGLATIKGNADAMQMQRIKRIVANTEGVERISDHVSFF